MFNAPFTLPFFSFLAALCQEFFSQLDQRVLNAFLKACDELTDILPEQEQQGLQEAVRKLHKQWKVSQTCREGRERVVTVRES